MRQAEKFFEDYIISELLLQNNDWNFSYRIQDKIINVNYKTNKNLDTFVSFVNSNLIPALKRAFTKNPFLKSMVLNMQEARDKAKKDLKGKTAQYVLNFNLDKL